MNGLLLALRRVNGVLARLSNYLGMTIVAIMVTALTASAITRYISGTGYDWLIELPPALVPWLVFPLLGPLLRSGDHIKVDLLPTFLPARKTLYLNLFCYTLTFIGALIFLVAGNEAVALFHRLGQLMELEIEIPIWWMYLAFPVGFGMLALFALELILETLRALFAGIRAETAGEPS
ncbi:TRAP-type C4-dicarboxylate transport system permease small subunit [Labrenzia sp. EL_142]|nr:TRAP-type C4-dicarboxylate transport system permease small subunit [Labrenzia sp. EL_142]